VVALDLAFALSDRWNLLGEVGSSLYTSPDPHDHSASIGAEFSPIASLRLSAVAVGGVTTTGQRAGLLFGITPKLRLF
jgi:hypothetical protein